MSEFPVERELVLDRLIDAPRDALFRSWTDVDLLKQWFAPASWIVSHAEVEARPGGVLRTTMRDPDGTEVSSPGVILELIPNQKLVMTDAFSTGWEPRDGAPFMVATITFGDEDGKTRYIARARHWTRKAAEQHARMGFQEGWRLCASQLEVLARSL